KIIDPFTTKPKLFGQNVFNLGDTIPVEIKLQSIETVGVKDVNFDLSLPYGVDYVEGSAYFQWGEDTIPIKAAGEAKMQLFDGAYTTAPSTTNVTQIMNIRLKELTNRDTIVGTYQSIPADRTVYLRFRAVTTCDFAADSAKVAITLFANRFCGDPAEGDGEIYKGNQMRLDGYRYYSLTQDFWSPEIDYAFCNNLDRQTLNLHVYRIGIGEFKNDTVVIVLPRYMELDYSDPTNQNLGPIRYNVGASQPIDFGAPGDDSEEKFQVIVGGNTLYRYRQDFDVVMDPLYAGDRTKDSTVIRFRTPYVYSQIYESNLDIAYEIDVKLRDQGTYPLHEYTYAHQPTSYIVAASTSTLLCNSANNQLGKVLSQEVMDTIHIHTAEVGLSKETFWQLAADKPSSFVVTNRYTIYNGSSSYIERIQLQDELYYMFNGQVNIDSVKIDPEVTPLVASSTLTVDSLYAGQGGPVSSGILNGRATAVVEMRYYATPTQLYTGQKFKNNAYLSSVNELGCAANDTSTWPLFDPGLLDWQKPDFSREPENESYMPAELQESSDTTGAENYNGDRLPSNNDIMTPIQFNIFRLEQAVPLPIYENIPENKGIHYVVVEKLGSDSAKVDIKFVGNNDRAHGWDFWLINGNSADPNLESRDSLAMLGTEPGCGIDAYPQSNQLDFTIPDALWTVKPGYTNWWTANVPLVIVDDDTYELKEHFYTHLHNAVSTSTDTEIQARGIALVNDTVALNITNNDNNPRVSIQALQDSIKEGTLPPSPYGATPAEFKVFLSNPSYREVTANWVTMWTGSYANIVEQVNPTNPPSIIFQPECPLVDAFGKPAYDTAKIVTLNVIADDLPEMAATVPVQIVNIKNGSVGTRTAQVVVVDDDIQIDTLQLRTLICKDDGKGAISIQAKGGEVANSGGSYRYEWTGPGGFTADHFVAGIETISNLPAGEYTVKITDVWSQRTDTIYRIFVDEPSQALDIMADIGKISCSGRSDGYLHLTVTGGWNGVSAKGETINPLPPYGFIWTKQEDGSYTATTADIDNLAWGTYYFTATDTAGCKIDTTLTLVDPDPLAIDSWKIENVICKYDNNGSIAVVIKDGVCFPTPNDPYVIQWTGPDGYTNNSTADIENLYAGIYTITVFDDGCDTLMQDLEVREPAIALAAHLDSTLHVICKTDATGSVFIKTTGGWNREYEYEWNDGLITMDDSIHSRNDLFGTETVSGSYVRDPYTAHVSDSAGCKVLVLPSPIAIIEPDEPLASTVTVTDETYQNAKDGKIAITVSGGILNCIVCGEEPRYLYQWADVPDFHETERYYLEHGLYTFSVKDGWGCVITDSIYVGEPLVIDDLPNVFTPNGDGINDLFLPTFNLQVYNRWGLLLYQGRDGWDGRYKGKMLPAGTYFYVLTDEDGKAHKSSVLLQLKK
ncbi:MAG: gliding motility-associated C-terminal domain-containing protein, partial [Bacteroidales bacterium]|nr:gliding motility-associated C-terminal domain-containing protein [Bacteroidales bacterium]